ncbi:chemerin-like receptor 1 isoform X2 [Thunnus thynnus]|uniref:chemerin-like receptor 1 isoform X2 n=1 Tax=Thunnus thynnus TaxID=8237 RepID=UPI003528D6B5
MTATPSYHTNTTGEEIGSSNDIYADLRGSLNIMSVVIYSLDFVLGVLGNGVVIWVTGYKMKKTVNTVWILNLAVADFLFTAFLPFSATYTALGFHWPFGNFMCKLDNTVRFLNMFASVYILVVISVDRYVSVVWPVWAQNNRNVRKASCVSLGVWVLGLILSTPCFIFRDLWLSPHDETIRCYDNYAFSDDFDNPSVIQLLMLRFKAMTITRFLLGFVVPFTVIVSCYAVIIHRLRRNRTRASHSSRPFKIIAAVITAFFLCWAPFYIMTLIELWYHIDNRSSEVLKLVITIGVPLATSLAYLNSCLNPLLYVFMGRDFKDKVRKSILNVFETAFREEVSRLHTDTKSVDTSQSLDMSILNTQV